jgi:hypothetical protein
LVAFQSTGESEVGSRNDNAKVNFLELTAIHGMWDLGKIDLKI